MYYIYMIKSCTKSYSYIGITRDIKNRLRRHNAGREKATRGRGPFKIVFLGIVANGIVARRWEKLFKSGFVKERIRDIY